MTDNASRLVQKLWSYCHVLRDDGLSYQDYLEQLTFLLFLKMAEERAELTGEEQGVIIAALERVETELGEGSFVFVASDEDIHTAIERRVTEIAGAAGAKLHTGRSRNDQVALDLRLYLRREGRAVAHRIHELQRVLVQRAEEASDVALPGYTHLQRAQPVLLRGEHRRGNRAVVVTRDTPGLGNERRAEALEQRQAALDGRANVCRGHRRCTDRASARW